MVKFIFSPGADDYGNIQALEGWLQNAGIVFGKESVYFYGEGARVTLTVDSTGAQESTAVDIAKRLNVSDCRTEKD